MQGIPKEASPPRGLETQGWKPFYASKELLDLPCPLCGDSRSRDIASEFGIAISQCLACEGIYTRTPLPDSQSHYAASRQAYLTKYGAVFEGRVEHPRTRNYDEHLDLLEGRASLGDLVDVGSHCGFFLSRARARGWRTLGVELSTTSAELARDHFGLTVRTGRLEECSLPPESVDAVTLIDVLEHVSHPAPLLQEVARILRPGGCVYIKVPNVRYVSAKHAVLRLVPGAVGDAFDAREHHVHYSRQSLARLLESSGLVPEVFYVPLPIQSGGPLRRLARALGSWFARRLPHGIDSPLATDIVAIGRRSIRESS